ncbi:MAG: hypothetical protein DRN40_00780 [Thermoplasmata archaeon]|nr:MAG: hypothetical protein DRN40_00780 [Thermoplasmata archaeon]
MRKVLIVEDKEGISQTMAALLEEKGMKVIACAALGREALRILEREKPDLMILDILLPDMESGEVYRRAKVLHPDLKVLFITSLSEEMAVKMVGEEKGREIMYKPFTIEGLLERIDKLFE